MERKCKTCGLRDPRQPRCQLTGLHIDPSADSCTKYTTTILTCSICHNLMLPSQAVIDSPSRILCINCSQKMWTCAMCTHNTGCAFETDPSPIPKYIQKTMQIGNMTTVTQVKNPARIEKTCKEKCSCFDPDFECLRQFNTCGKCENI